MSAAAHDPFLRRGGDMPFPPPPAPPPGVAVPPSRPPFSAGSVVSRSFSVWAANFVPFSIVTLAVHLPVILLAALAPPDEGPLSGWSMADRILSALGQLVVTGALTYGVLESLRGGRTPVGALFATGFRKVGWVFVTSLRVGLWIVLGVFLLVVPAIAWYCALFVAVPAVVVEEELDSGEALERSRELTAGSRWAILAVALVDVVVTLAAAAIATAVVAFAPFLPQGVSLAVATAIVALASSFAACAAAVTYHDLRIAKEGVATADLVKVFE